jgi:hypothetical protein
MLNIGKSKREKIHRRYSLQLPDLRRRVSALSSLALMFLTTSKCYRSV